MFAADAVREPPHRHAVRDLPEPWLNLIIAGQ
jgi:hypothetical protein